MSNNEEKNDYRPLKVAVFLDGTPGHEKQTKGIVHALGRLIPLDVTELKIERQSPLRDVWLWVRYLFSLDSFDAGGHGKYDVLIGTGSHTHISLLSCKKNSSALAFTCMAPLWFVRNRFDLCFVPQHDGIKPGKHVFLTTGPPNSAEAGKAHDQNKGLILLGGVDIKSHYWNSEEIAGYVQELVSKETDKEWIISSSPRTPKETVSLIENLALQFYNVTFFKYEDTSPGWVEEQYGKNNTVWVTADSMSMIYEALSAGCTVGILPVVWKNRNNKFKRSEDFLLDHGLVASFAAWRQGNPGWKVKQPLNEAGRCAAEIVKIWRRKS